MESCKDKFNNNTSSKVEIRKKTSSKSDSRTGKPQEVWDKPVSKRYYERLRAKVSGIVHAFGYVRGYTDEMMKCIDRYLANGEVPVRRYCDEEFLILFFALRADIDEAIMRSASARRRAAERRECKEAENREKNTADSSLTGPSGRSEMGNTRQQELRLFSRSGRLRLDTDHVKTRGTSSLDGKHNSVDLDTVILRR